MTSDKKNISLLADLFFKSGLRNIVISPGSRNAPVIITFVNNPFINSFSVVDERSAAFFAIGIALQTGITTAVSCTSGSAVLNYSPAIAEAFYQKIPLLVITSDRPKHLIDIGDGQTIIQENVFKNFIKKSYILPENIDNPELFKQAEITINDALYNCLLPEPGPVHINVPFDEPLYNSTDELVSGHLYKFDISVKTEIDSIKTISKLLNTNKKVLMIAGQHKPDSELNQIINKYSKLKNVVVLTETTSNIYGNNCIDTIDNVVATFSLTEIAVFNPEVIISINGQIVSKIVKKFLRNSGADFHFHISPSGEKMDTYHCLTESITGKPSIVLQQIYKDILFVESDYSDHWITRRDKVSLLREKFLKSLEFCDLKVFDDIFKKLPSGIVLHLGNSTPIRYSQLFGVHEEIVFLSNRGVSGIDGQVSTAVGYSYFSEKQNILITGDLGFFYDSNGLMNKYLRSNFKIILINNRGGGIFRYISGPEKTSAIECYFEAKHNWNAKYICKTFDIDYTVAYEDNYPEEIYGFLNNSSQKPMLLEIITPNEKNGELLRAYFEYLKDGCKTA